MSLDQTAQRLINKSGRTVTLFTTSTQPPDPQKPWRTLAEGAGDQQLALKAVFVDEKDNELVRLLITQGSGRAPKDQPRRGKRGFLVAALDVGAFPIDKVDRVEDGVETWRVQGVTRVQPGDVKYIYQLEVAL